MISSPPKIRRFEAGDEPRWDAFVAAQPQATFFHRSGWRSVLGETIGHPTHYLLAERGDAITGILPLAHVKSLLFGNQLSSLPFCSYGGAVATDPDSRDALEDEALRIARELGVGALEFRNLTPSGRGRPTKDLYETFSKPVFASEQENMQAIRGKQRNVVRKGIKSGLIARADTIDNFYRAYAESVRNLGTPVFPKNLFAAIHAEFPADTEFLSACLDEQLVASAMLFYWRDEVCPYYWGGTALARSVAGNDFLCWQVLCRAAARGCTTFDFGRSKIGTGSRQWKVNWGFEPRPLTYEYELVRDAAIPEVNPLNPRYRLFIELWKRLPVPVTLVLGPWLARSLG